MGIASPLIASETSKNAIVSSKKIDKSQSSLDKAGKMARPCVADVRNLHPVQNGQMETASLRADTAIRKLVCRPASLFKIEKRCFRGVGFKNSVARYNMNKITNCYKTSVELMNGTHHTARGDDFEIFDPKHRTVTSTKYNDRVPQASWVVNFFYPYIAPHLIKNNFACLAGKGVDAAREAFKQLLSEADPTDLILNGDISKYFNNINHGKLNMSIAEIAFDEWAIAYHRDVIDSNGEIIGVTLGSEVNQLSAVTHLNNLDHKIEHNVRYMDDIKIVGPHEMIMEAYRIIVEELDKLGLKLSPKKTYIQSVSQPCRFLGFSFLRHEDGHVTMKRLPDKLNNEKRKLRKMKEKGVPMERIEEHYRCVRAHMKHGSRSGVVKLDRYFNNLFYKEKSNAEHSQKRQGNGSQTRRAGGSYRPRGGKEREGRKNRGPYPSGRRVQHEPRACHPSEEDDGHSSRRRMG